MTFDPAEHLARTGVATDAPAERLEGGYTNEVWRVGDLVVKRYDREARPGLFGNDPLAEARALVLLAPSGVAPAPVHFDEQAGVVVYRFATGKAWDGGVERVARLLGGVHALPGHEFFRALPVDGGALLADGDRFRASTAGPSCAPSGRRRCAAARSHAGSCTVTPAPATSSTAAPT